MFNCPHCQKEIEAPIFILNSDSEPIFPGATMSKWEHNYLNSNPLPETLHIGRKVKVIEGKHKGRIGIVTDHWKNGDNCSGGFGDHLYQLEGDLKKYGCKNNSCAIRVKDCELVD